MNKLKGKIISIQCSKMMSLITVDVNGHAFSAIILEGKNGQIYYKAGDALHLIFKETEVSIAKNLSGQISFRNRFPGVITNIDRGKVLTKVILDYNNNTIESIISTASADEMTLQKNDYVEWLVKTNEISLMTI